MSKTPQKKNRRNDAGHAGHTGRKRAIAGATMVGVIAAGLGAALRFGWLDRLLGKRGAEHAAPDLAADAPVPGTNRAPDAFRPDPTAAVPSSEREALRPATGPSPTLSADRGEMANQTAAANG